MPLIFRICDTGYFCESYSVMACSMVSLLTFGWPPFLPRALAAFSPARVRSTISSLSNWLTPLKMVKRSLPCGVVVSSHGSFKDFMFAPALSIFSTRSKRSLTERLSRVSSQMMMVSPFRRVRRRMESSGRSFVAPVNFSWKMVSHPYCLSASTCQSRFWSAVESGHIR